MPQKMPPIADVIRRGSMDPTDRDGGLEVARSLARSGAYGNWKAVETRMHQMGFYHADLWFGGVNWRSEIDAICAEFHTD